MDYRVMPGNDDAEAVLIAAAVLGKACEAWLRYVAAEKSDDPGATMRLLQVSYGPP